MTTGFYYSEACLGHDTGGHPESRKRLEAVVARLSTAEGLGSLSFPASGPADLDAVRLVHQPSYVDRVIAMARRGGGWLDGDTVVSPGSEAAALWAVGCTVDAALAVTAGELENAFVAVRPPGHHATPDRGMGFCLFNNIAVAARLLVSRKLAERVAIVDFDVHHGNGTQEIFYDDPSVLFFSTHQSPLYPGTGSYMETGHGAGAGTTVNVPLPPGTGDDAYLAAFDEILVPSLRRYRPDLILVSAGYDSHWRDPLANMQATVPGFRAMVEKVKELALELCGGKVLCVLEGGYDVAALASAVEATVRVLAGSDLQVPDPHGAPPSPLNRIDVEQVIVAIRRINGF